MDQYKFQTALKIEKIIIIRNSPLFPLFRVSLYCIFNLVFCSIDQYRPFLWELKAMSMLLTLQDSHFSQYLVTIFIACDSAIILWRPSLICTLCKTKINVWTYKNQCYAKIWKPNRIIAEPKLYETRMCSSNIAIHPLFSTSHYQWEE